METINFEGSGISTSVLSFFIDKHICTGIGTANVILDSKKFNINDLSTWKVFEFYSGSDKLGKFFVSSYSLNSDGTINVDCQDASKRLVDYYIDGYYDTSTRHNVKYYIDKILDETGSSPANYVSYGDEGIEGLTEVFVSDQDVIGNNTAYDELIRLLQMSGYHIYFDSDGTPVIFKNEIDIENYTDLETSEILKVTLSYSDAKARNRAVVWGKGYYNSDTESVDFIYADEYVDTDWQIDSNDKRTVVISNGLIESFTDAYNISQEILMEFKDVKPVITIDFAGIVTDYSFADYLLGTVKDVYLEGAVTSITYNLSEKGKITTITLNEICPRLIGFYRYTGGYIYAGTTNGVFRKPVGGKAWDNFSTGLDDVVDSFETPELGVSTGMLCCITHGTPFVRTTKNSDQWKEVNVGNLYDNNNEKCKPPTFNACDATHSSQLTFITTGENINNGLNRAFVISPSPNDGSDYKYNNISLHGLISLQGIDISNTGNKIYAEVKEQQIPYSGALYTDQCKRNNLLLEVPDLKSNNITEQSYFWQGYSINSYYNKANDFAIYDRYLFRPHAVRHVEVISGFAYTWDSLAAVRGDIRATSLLDNDYLYDSTSEINHEYGIAHYVDTGTYRANTVGVLTNESKYVIVGVFSIPGTSAKHKLRFVEFDFDLNSVTDLAETIYDDKVEILYVNKNSSGVFSILNHKKLAASGYDYRKLEVNFEGFNVYIRDIQDTPYIFDSYEYNDKIYISYREGDIGGTSVYSYLIIVDGISVSTQTLGLDIDAPHKFYKHDNYLYMDLGSTHKRIDLTTDTVETYSIGIDPVFGSSDNNTTLRLVDCKQLYDDGNLAKIYEYFKDYYVLQSIDESPTTSTDYIGQPVFCIPQTITYDSNTYEYSFTKPYYTDDGRLYAVYKYDTSDPLDPDKRLLIETYKFDDFPTEDTINNNYNYYYYEVIRNDGNGYGVKDYEDGPYNKYIPYAISYPEYDSQYIKFLTFKDFKNYAVVYATANTTTVANDWNFLTASQSELVLRTDKSIFLSHVKDSADILYSKDDITVSSIMQSGMFKLYDIYTFDTYISGSSSSRIIGGVGVDVYGSGQYYFYDTTIDDEVNNYDIITMSGVIYKIDFSNETSNYKVQPYQFIYVDDLIIYDGTTYASSGTYSSGDYHYWQQNADESTYEEINSGLIDNARILILRASDYV